MQHSFDNKIRIVEGGWSLRADAKQFAPFLKLPATKAVAEVKVDAGMVFHIVWMLWNAVRFEICRGADDYQAHFSRNRHRDYVALNELSKLNTSVVFTGHRVDGIVRMGDLKNDVRIPAIA